jgi:hypothetical protein
MPPRRSRVSQVEIRDDGDRMQLKAHGIETTLPPGWEGRIGLRAAPAPPPGVQVLGATVSRAALATLPPAVAAVGPTGHVDEVESPVVHLANFPLPENRGDFGSGAVDLMTDANVLVVLFEYGPECAGTSLFRRKGLPSKLTPSMFSRSALQRTITGQAGCQIFFTVGDRAFCCYTVLGRQSAALRVLPAANAVLAATTIGSR